MRLFAVALALAVAVAAAGPALIRAPVAAASASAGGFAFSSAPLSARVRARVTGVSWHAGCPVALADLRYARIAYRGFDGRRHLGEMVVHRDAVRAVRRAFAALYRAGFPIRRMRLVDD